MGPMDNKRNVPPRVQSGAFGMHPFDPAKLLSDEMREKEVKNGRLAMVRPEFGCGGSQRLA